MSTAIDLTGKHFGKLTVICRGPDRINKSGKSVRWKCLCECGVETLVDGRHLKNGHTKSCGCEKQISAQKMGKQQATHNRYPTRLYHIWNGLKMRCQNKNNDRFSAYGGRGITVCAEWAGSFETFRDWALANGYRDDLSIDRIDVNGNYCPGNCRWATIVEQNNNKRNNRFITLCGSTKTVAEWSRAVGIASGTIIARLRKGWGEYEAVFTPLLH